MSEWNKFLAEIKQAETELGNPKEIWYRGHSNSAWDLMPSLMRQADWIKKEKELFYEFKKTASRLFDKRTNDWEILFDMQHYWIPTRLLDWSTVMGVAVAFILHDDHGHSGDSAIFVLDPEGLNRISGRDEIINVPEDKTYEYQPIYWDHRPVRIEKPLAIRPSMITDRIQAQKGVFTVHGMPENGFESGEAANCVKKVILPGSAKEEARDFLKWANLDEYTIYPDIVGMARHIKRKIFNI